MSKRTRLLGRLKHVYSHNTKLVLDVENDDIGLIIEGVEKQIAKKPNYVDICPCCETYNETWLKRVITVKKDEVYCWHCGHKARLGAD